MEIMVNNEIKELSIIDPKTGCDWVTDLIGNADGFDGYDGENEIYMMGAETYKWWDEYIKTEDIIQNRAREIQAELSNEDSEKFEREMQNAASNDMEMTQLEQLQIVKNWSTTEQSS